MIKNLICLTLLTLGCYQQTHAQNKPWNEEANRLFIKETITPSEQIFEGTITDVFQYTGTDNKKYDACIVQIHKIFKGNLKPGKVAFLRGTQLYYDDALKQYKSIYDREGLTHEDMAPSMSTGLTCLFFSKTSPLDAYKPNLNVTLENTTGLTPLDWRIYDLAYDPDNAVVGITATLGSEYYKTFKKTAELYQFMSSFPGISIVDYDHQVIEKAGPPVYPKTEATPLSPAEYKVIKDHADKSRAIMLERSKKKVPDVSNLGQLAQVPELTYTFENATYTGTSSSDAYLEFDISLASDPAKYLGGAAAYITFNPVVFGENLVQNGKITITRGSLVTSETDYAFFYQDKDNDPTIVIIGGFTQIQYPTRTSIDNNPRQFCHVKIKVASCTQATLLEFTRQTDMKAFSLYSETVSGDYFNEKLYDVIVATDDEDHLACAPVIEDFTPSIQAGTGAELTITGKFFGSTQGAGNAFFKDANDGALPYTGLNASDITSWSDNEIKIKVPAVITPKNTVTNNYPVPASEYFRVNNKFSGSGYSPSQIEITYAIKTDITSAKTRFNLIGYPSSSTDKVIKINIDQAVSANTEAMQCVRAAMKQWTCISGVNWQIGDVTSGTYADNDAIHTIYFDEVGVTPPYIMITDLQQCSSSPFNKGFDIRIDPTPNGKLWNYKIANQYNGIDEYDFYESILHELGHGQLLRHVNNPDDIMFRSTTTAKNVRKIGLRQHDKDGGIDVMDVSKNYNPASQCSAFTITPLSPSAAGCNTSSSEPLVARGVNISGKCAPGTSGKTAPNPVLLPKVVGGIAPFSYYWEVLSGNSTTLDNYYIEQPTITASSSPHKVKYKFTVIDNSDVPQTSTVDVEVNLKSTLTYDYSMRDSYEDVLDEPSTQKSGNFWDSPDIWNRKSKDAGTVHQNPEYYANATGDNKNHLYVKIRNVGCIAPPADKHYLKLYWTKASTGENWDDDWTVAVDAQGDPEGLEITKLETHGYKIAPIPAGTEVDIPYPWDAPKPELYTDFDATLKKIDVCVLARIESGSGNPPYAHPYGMTTPEVQDDTGVPAGALRKNVLGNNDIVTRNMIVTNLNPNDLTGGVRNGTHYVNIANPTGIERNFSINFVGAYGTTIRDFSALGAITLDLGRELYQRWILGGLSGSGFTLIPGTTSMLITDPTALILNNIMLYANEKRPVEITFAMTSGVVVDQTQVFDFSLSQSLTGDTDPIGGVNFHVNVLGNSYTQGVYPMKAIDENDPSKDEAKTNDSEVSKKQFQNFIQDVIVYPNPTNHGITVATSFDKEVTVKTELRDLLGRLIKVTPEERLSGVYTKSFDLENLSNGLYTVTVITGDRIIVKKVIKQ